MKQWTPICHLAITSIPVQEAKKFYHPAVALKEGTIFPDLDYLFYVLEKPNAANKIYDSQELKESQIFEQEPLDKLTQPCALIKYLSQIDLYLTDLTLYLDIHPEDQTCIYLFFQANKSKKKLLQKLNEQAIPLTRSAMVDTLGNTDYYTWASVAMPWEGGCE